jgi:hypothetical protein
MSGRGGPVPEHVIRISPDYLIPGEVYRLNPLFPLFRVASTEEVIIELRASNHAHDLSGQLLRQVR